MLKLVAATAVLIVAALSGRPAAALDTLSVALTSKAFQYVPLVIAQDRGYMKEEGLDLKFVFMQNAPGLQALIANQVQFPAPAAALW
jgi:NitT/TauT family transport system substrate-binding protein